VWAVALGECIGGVVWGIWCGGARGEWGVEDTSLGESTYGMTRGEGAEPHLWGVVLNSEGECLVGRSVKGGALREGDMLNGKQPEVGAERPSW
jgi:hypothetical protein